MTEAPDLETIKARLASDASANGITVSPEWLDAVAKENLDEYNSVQRLKLEEMDEKRKKILTEAIRGVQENLKEYFNVKELPKMNFRIIRKGSPGPAASYRPLFDEWTIREEEINKPSLRLSIAEELTHYLRESMGIRDNDYTTEFFGHLASLLESEKTGIGKTGYARSLRNYSNQLLYGLYYSPEDIEKTGRDYLKFVKKAKIHGDRSAAIKEYRRVSDATLVLENLNERFSPTRYLEKISVKKETDIGTKSEEKQFLKDLEQDKGILQRWLPYKKATEKDQNMKVHLVGYDTAERVLPYIKAGVITPAELFHKDPKEIEKILVYKDYKKAPNEEQMLRRIKRMTRPSSRSIRFNGPIRFGIKSARESPVRSKVFKKRILRIK